ncbi:hypothetical protein LTR29_008273 [Friedmanniomyces endolithicus]|nr:hypothetical protein LTR29_008273 [Friedmanniomyces endolithicus]
MAHEASYRTGAFGGLSASWASSTDAKFINGVVANSPNEATLTGLSAYLEGLTKYGDVGRMDSSSGFALIVTIATAGGLLHVAGNRRVRPASFSQYREVTMTAVLTRSISSLSK